MKEVERVTKATNRSVKADVIEVMLRRFDVTRVLLRPVLQSEDLLLPILGVDVEVHLAVHAVN